MIENNENTQASETEKSKVLRFVACNNPFIWKRINSPSKVETLEDDVADYIHAMRNSDKVKDNLFSSPNALKYGEEIRLPKGFSFNEKVYKGVREFSLDDITTDYLDYKVDNPDYEHYKLRSTSYQGIPPREMDKVLFLRLPKYLVEDPECVGDFDTLIKGISERQELKSGHRDWSLLKPIDWRSFITKPAEPEK